MPRSTRFSRSGLAAMGAPDPRVGYRVPDLSGLYDKNILNVALDALVGRWPGPADYPYRGMWVNLVRLSDQAIREYELARLALREYVDHGHEGRISPFYRAIDHFENAISATHRATLNSKQLEVHLGRRLNQPTERQESLLRAARNHVEHMDDKLGRRMVKPNEVAILIPLSFRLQVGKVELPYRDLASCVRKNYRNVESIRRAPSV